MCCPFHEDSTPSMKIYVNSNTFYCFGCCVGGDVISFVMHLFRLGFREALLRLNDDFYLGLSGAPPAGRQAMKMMRHEQWVKEKALAAFREEYGAKTMEARALRFRAAPSGEDHGSPKWGDYAAGLARLEYLEQWFSETKWR